MNSLYKRQMAMMVGVMLLSFSLLAAAFMLLSYRYIISETRDSVERNAGYIANFTADNYLDVSSEFYSGYVASIALISNSYIIISDAGGNIRYATDGVYFYSYENAAIPENVVNQVSEQGSYTGMTRLGGIFSERRYTAALPISVTIGGFPVAQGLVLVSADASSLNEMWSSTATIFFFSAVVVLLISFIASSLTSAHQARPLNEMAEAARKFGRGEFDVRVTGYEDRCHELKTPMTTISGFAEGILDGTIPPEREKEFLQVIVSETRRLSRLVRRMLDLSRLNALAENAVTAQEQFDLVEVVSQVIISLESKITSRSLDVDVQMPEDKVMVWGDPDSITQVCYNLLDNAAKFAASGTAITLQITKKDGKAYTSVRNLGATIPAEELPLLFDRFHKADYSRSMDRDGVGLGLYIVKTILGNLKENITVTSEDGVTEFTFTLTLA